MTQLAQVTLHELAHNRGVKEHREMLDWWDGSLDISWLTEDLTLVPKIAKLPPKRDLINERHIHALKMLKKHETKLKRQTTLTKKWRKKVKYYEKKQAERGATLAVEKTAAAPKKKGR